jgi:hypothetical protein
MLAAAPVNRQDDLPGMLINVGEDLLDQRPKQLLARTHTNAGCIPRGIKIVRKSGEIGFGRW